MSSYVDSEFPNGRRFKVGESQWAIVGVYSIGNVTKYLFIEAGPGSAYKGVSKMTPTKDELKRVIARGEFDKVYPWKAELVR